MTKIMVRAAVLAGAIAVTLAGCGSSGSTATSAGSSSSAAVAPVSLPGTVNEAATGDATGGSLEVELDDFYFGPSFIKATPGETITLHLKNEGKTDHTFTSTALNVDEQLAPDQTKDVTVTMPAAGATQFHCKFHEGKGMQGAFFFKAGDAVGAAAGGASSTTTSSSDGGYYN